MPELPEVETVRRGLEPYMLGRTITQLQLNRGDLRFPFPLDFAARLTGAHIVAVRRRAKYLLVHVHRPDENSREQALAADGQKNKTMRDWVWISHLGMTGRFDIIPPGEAQPSATIEDGRYYSADAQKHVHVCLRLDDGTQIHYADPRRFGYMDLIAADQPYRPFVGMGPEPDAALCVEDVVGRLAGRASPIKTALLDQKIIAGLGNIYVCEALHHAQISPRRRAGTIGPKRAARLVPAIQQVIAEAIAAGGSSLRDFRHGDGSLGYFQHRFAVYDRAGAPCSRPSCVGIVQRIVQAGRSTFFCSRCQR